MKTSLYLLPRSVSCALIIVFLFAGSVPAPAHAATSKSTSVSETASASINLSSLLIESGKKARIVGTTSDSVAKVRVTITASSSKKAIFKSKSIKVQRNAWSAKVTKKLKDGAYTVSVYEDEKGKLKLLTEGTLNVGIPPATLRISSIPLLTGGTAHPGTTVPVSYLQIINQSSSTVAMKGFWVRHDGSAPPASVIGLSSVDNSGGSRGSTEVKEGNTPFVKGLAYVPSGAVFAPGERKLFTIKAQLSASSGQYAGSALSLNLTGIDAAATLKGAFPIVGTTWVLGAY